MPRRQLGEKAMTDAERQHKRRERLRQEHDEQRKRKEAGAQYLRAAKQAWVDDHPDHNAADFDHWGSCAATPTQERHWHDWEAAFSAKYWKGEPAAKAKPASQELVEARKEIERLRQRIHDLEAVLAHERAAKKELNARAMNMNTNIDGAKAMAGLAIVLALLLSSGAATAQQQNRTYQNSMGRNVGRSVTDTRGNTTFYDAMGRNTGRWVSNGNSTIIYDSMGRRTGTVTTKGR